MSNNSTPQMLQKQCLQDLNLQDRSAASDGTSLKNKAKHADDKWLGPQFTA